MATHTEAGLAVLTAQRALEVWYSRRRPSRVLPHKSQLYDFAADHIGREAPLRYLEFGVHEGVSIGRMTKLFSNPSARFIGFDSFVGLPSAWAGMEAGHFSTGGKIPVVEDRRMDFVPGWFQNTAPGFLGALKIEAQRPTLIHFDADLYSSTLFLLTALWWHLPEYYFIFDEFMAEELAAMRHFDTAYPVDIEFLAETYGKDNNPLQVFGRLRNTRMAVDGIG